MTKSIAMILKISISWHEESVKKFGSKHDLVIVILVPIRFYNQLICLEQENKNPTVCHRKQK